MNKERRQKLGKAQALLAQARDLIDEVLGDEQEAFDNMPESLQESDKGEEMSEGLAALEEMPEALEEIEGQLDDLGAEQAPSPVTSRSAGDLGL